MSEPEGISKNSISISLPRSFYTFFMEHELWNEYSSFSDWCRDAIRKSRDLWAIKRPRRKPLDETEL